MQHEAHGDGATLLSSVESAHKKAHEKMCTIFSIHEKSERTEMGKKASNKSENRFFPPPPQLSIKLHNYTLCLCSVCVWVGERKSE